MNTTNLKMRPIKDTDYPAFVALHNLTHTDSPISISEAKHFDESRKQDILINDMLERNGELIANVRAMNADSGSKQVRIDLYLHPEKVDKALRIELYDYLTSKLVTASAFITRVREDWINLRDFFEVQGFAELERMWESKLDVQAFDATLFQAALAKAEAAGITFRTLADLPNNEITQRLVYQTVAQELLGSVPTAEPLNIWPFETWLERYWNSPARNPESAFLAFSGSEFVGICELYKSDDPKKLKNGITAVKKAYQRQGIAMSLKLKAAKYAKQQGAKEIATQNHSINQPMLAINEAMGFKKDPAWIRLKKEVSSL